MELPKRKRNRLKGYDYSRNGVCFVTICVKDRLPMLLRPMPVGAHSVRPLLSDIGIIVEAAINNITKIYEYVCVDEYIIMPNHVHFLISVDTGDSGRTLCAPTISRVENTARSMLPNRLAFPFGRNRFTIVLFATKKNIKKFGCIFMKTLRTGIKIVTIAPSGVGAHSVRPPQYAIKKRSYGKTGIVSKA